MDILNQRFKTLSLALDSHNDVCSSQGEVDRFPQVLYDMFYMDYIGVIICHCGSFSISVDFHDYDVSEGNTVFINENTYIKINNVSADLRVSILFYKVDIIRDLLGSTVQAIRLYNYIDNDRSCVWNTGSEKDIAHYVALLNSNNLVGANEFEANERKLLLLAITYRLCAIYANLISSQIKGVGRKKEIFFELMRLISLHYKEHRDVAFYADKMCLSPKYLSSLVKSLCGYTVQQLVFKAILRHCIFLIHNTNKSIQEISEMHHFPTLSSFGKFFKKQTGKSPRLFREQKGN
ncbi:MAG: helix-turn-helix domain-containing protein [Prevotella sp.]|nr:helix-turn-helix domain-containing protein [Prevotella sp.]